MYPQYRTLKLHPFNLTGLKVGDRFIGCPRCGYQLSPEVAACVLECPTCLGRLTDYRVTEEDVK